MWSGKPCGYHHGQWNNEDNWCYQTFGKDTKQPKVLVCYNFQHGIMDNERVPCLPLNRNCSLLVTFYISKDFVSLLVMNATTNSSLTSQRWLVEELVMLI